MKRWIPLLILALTAGLPAQASTFKCSQPGGGVTYQDHECTGADAIAAITARQTGVKIVKPSTHSEFDLAREDYKTAVHLPRSGEGPPPKPPADVFETVKYPAPAGAMTAYLTPDPKDGHRHPAIVWITGGDCNSIGDVWKPAARANDQTAAAFRQAGIAMMFPSLRGGNDNPGTREAFYGETNDVLAAADYLARQPWVDPSRIYLGGHSTGGTLVLLTSEMSSRFRAVFSFGPVARADAYPRDLLPVDFTRIEPRELILRAPEVWLSSIRSRVFVFEGEAQGNIGELRFMRQKSSNPMITFVPVPGATHFSILAPTNELLAAKILADSGPTTTVSIAPQEIVRAMH